MDALHVYVRTVPMYIVIIYTSRFKCYYIKTLQKVKNIGRSVYTVFENAHVIYYLDIQVIPLKYFNLSGQDWVS